MVLQNRQFAVNKWPSGESWLSDFFIMIYDLLIVNIIILQWWEISKLQKKSRTKPAIACSVDRVGGHMNRLIRGSLVADDEHETENVETLKAARWAAGEKYR